MSTSILPNQKVQPNERGPFWSNWRIWAAVVALLFALGISILFGSKQAAQRGYFGQRLFPPKEAFDFNLINQDAQPLQLSDPLVGGRTSFDCSKNALFVAAP